MKLGVLEAWKLKFPASTNADFPNLWYLSELTNPVKLLTEIFKNSSSPRGGKSVGKVPFILLFETSKYFNERTAEMGFRLPEILQLEMFRFSSSVRFSNPEGRLLRSLCERSTTLSLGKPESQAKLVNLLFERLRTRIEEKEPFPEVCSDPMLPPNLFIDRLTSTRLGKEYHNQPGIFPLRRFLERSRFCKRDMFLRKPHAMDPLSFLDESFSSLIGGFEQLESTCSNHERLKPETDLKAL